jgi:hypothetical protein
MFGRTINANLIYSCRDVLLKSPPGGLLYAHKSDWRGKCQFLFDLIPQAPFSFQEKGAFFPSLFSNP